MTSSLGARVRGFVVACSCFVLATAADVACAQMRTLELPLSRQLATLEMSVAEDGSVWLLSGGQSPGEIAPQYSLVRVSPDWKIELERPLDAGTYAHLAAHAGGALLVRGHPPRPERDRTPGFRDRYELLWLGGTATPRVLHAWLVRESPADLYAPAVGDDAVYVAQTSMRPENTNRFASTIAKLAFDGTVLWQRELGDGRIKKLAATGDAVVVASWAMFDGRSPRRPPALDLTTLSSDGDLLWQLETDLESSFPDLVYVAPDRVVLAAEGGADDGARALAVDVRTRATREVQLPSIAHRPWLRAAEGDLVFFSHVLHQPYVARMTLEGERRWWRGVQLASGIRFDPSSYTVVRDVQPLPNGRLAMLVESGRRGPSEHRTILLDVDARLEELATAAQCITADPVAIVALQRRVERDFGIAVNLGDLDSGRDPAVLASPCGLPTDEAYAAFLETLHSELRARGAAKWPTHNEAVYVRVVPSGEPFRLTHYRFNAAVMDAPRTSFTLRARADSAAALARHIVETLEPHKARLDPLVREFATITDRSLSVLGNEPESSSPEFLSSLEDAAEQLLAEVRQLSEQQRASLAADRGRVRFFRLQPDGFGTVLDPPRPPRPVTAARDVLMESIGQR